MNSENVFSSSNDRKDTQQLNRNHPVEFTLTYDQYVILQHNLPKKYSLLQYKPSKRNPAGASFKFPQQENQNFSKMSGNFQKSEDVESRSKRPRPKKVDRFLQNQIPQKAPKRVPERFGLNLDEEMLQCYNILQNLKKHKSAYPFLQPVDPKLDGAYNYLEIIKQPMDLSTVEVNLKNGQYQTSGQFHGDINKIWMNSYAYNEKSSPFYKLTLEMQKYYKHLCMNEGSIKKDKVVIKQQKPTNKDPKMSKKESSYDKNSEKEQNLRENDRKSMSGGNDHAFGDSDQFLYDK